MGKITQSDIAKELGISRTTVARALNGTGSIDEDTKKMIKEKAKELGYVANPIAKSLAMKKKIIIYAFLIDAYNQYLNEKIEQGIRSIEKEFKPFNVIIKIIKHKSEEPQKQIETLCRIINEEIMDGIILTPMRMNDSYPDLNNTLNRKVPLVTLNLDLEKDQRMMYVGPDYRKSGALAAEILANYIGQKGKIGIISSNLHYESVDKRLEGFEQKISTYTDIEIIGPYYVEQIEDNYSIAKKMMQEHQDLKSIYTTTDIMHIQKAVKDMNYKGCKLIGNDLTIEMKEEILKGNIHASIHQRPYLQGYLAGRAILNKIIYNKSPKQSELFIGFDVACQENIELEDVYRTYFSY
jgi:LacI family transcriptional regulator